MIAPKLFAILTGITCSMSLMADTSISDSFSSTELINIYSEACMNSYISAKDASWQKRYGFTEVDLSEIKTAASKYAKAWQLNRNKEGVLIIRKSGQCLLMSNSSQSLHVNDEFEGYLKNRLGKQWSIEVAHIQVRHKKDGYTERNALYDSKNSQTRNSFRIQVFTFTDNGQMKKPTMILGYVR